MMFPTARPARRFLGRVGATAAVSVLVAACTAAGATSSPGAGIGGSTSPSYSANGFYLRASQTQALAPQYTFGSLPPVTIADGKFYDGMVAVPAVYPGPIYTGLWSRTVSAEGVATIVGEAQAAGLLGSKTDFIERALPGGVSCHIEIVVGGVTHDLTGACNTDVGTSAAPGSPAAFTAFWNKLTSLPVWLAAELGPSAPYDPSSLAVLVGPPTDASLGIAPDEKPWPLATPFASFGSPAGSVDYRCAVVTGADLAKLLPAVQAANGLTRFVDGQSIRKSVKARVVLPGEPGPC